MIPRHTRAGEESLSGQCLDHELVFITLGAAFRVVFAAVALRGAFDAFAGRILELHEEVALAAGADVAGKDTVVELVAG